MMRNDVRHCSFLFFVIHASLVSTHRYSGIQTETRADLFLKRWVDLRNNRRGRADNGRYPVNCPEANCVIDAYGDDELASRDAVEVDAHLDACRVCPQRVAARASLGRLIRRVPYYAAPDRLRVAVAIARRPVRVSRQLLAWAAMVTVVVSLGSGAVIHTVGARRTAAATTTMAQDVVAGHVRALIRCVTGPATARPSGRSPISTTSNSTNSPKRSIREV
jgi:hypothetical protein